MEFKETVKKLDKLSKRPSRLRAFWMVMVEAFAILAGRRRTDLLILMRAQVKTLDDGRGALEAVCCGFGRRDAAREIMKQQIASMERDFGPRAPLVDVISDHDIPPEVKAAIKAAFGIDVEETTKPKFH